MFGLGSSRPYESSVLRGRDETLTDFVGEMLRCQIATESDDPRRELRVGGGDAVAVRLEECQHRDEGEALVAVEKRLAFGDAVREDGCLKRDVGVVVVRVRRRAGQRSLER